MKNGEVSRFAYQLGRVEALFNKCMITLFPNWNLKRRLELAGDVYIVIPSHAADLVGMHLGKEHPSTSFMRRIHENSIDYDTILEKQWITNTIDCVSYPTTSSLLIMFANGDITKEQVLDHIEKFILYDNDWKLGKKNLINLPEKNCVDNDLWQQHVVKVIENYIVSGEIPDKFLPVGDVCSKPT